MTTLRLHAEALQASRFALSPLAETLSELAAARRDLDQHAESARARVLGAWLGSDPFADGLVRLITSTKYLPDFIAIPPTGMHTRITDELSVMSGTDDEAARATLEKAQLHSWTPRDLDWVRGTRTAARAAQVLGRAWDSLVHGDWPRRRAVMERDIRHRAGVIALHGWKTALDGIATKIRLTAPDAIQFSTQTFPDLQIGRGGLILVPHTAHAGQWMCAKEGSTALVYRARGSLADSAQASSGISSLLGPTRTRIILELDGAAATPSQLGATLSLSLGTVSAHLSALSEAGVLTKRRSSRAVYYELSAAGATLRSLC